ncbi:MAG: AMP-binding protein [Pseudomonadota bacterium]|nr:AMP-binding protein [Pseudomonadota bacterium]
MDLGRMLEESTRQFPGNIAFIHDKCRMTHEELNGAVNALAHHFRGLGLAKGDKIAIMLPNCPEFIISYFAAQKLGAVAVTLNVLSTPYELRHLLGDSDAKLFITQGILAKRYEEIKADLPLCKNILTTNGMDTRCPYTQAIADNPSSWVMPDIDDNDPAVMIYTSGLTGRPLGAQLTHANLLTQAALLEEAYNGTSADRGLAVIPFFHSFGAAANLLTVIHAGASVVLMERFTLESIFAAIERKKVSYICAVPRLFLGMIFHQGAERYDVSSLRFCITGGSTMPAAFIPLFQEKFGAPLVEGYGLTEASPICTITRLEQENKPGAIGTPIAGVEARIVADNNTEAPRGETGELIIRGKNVMKGYYKDEGATAEVIRDGWLHTGDLGRMDEDGYIFLTGRKKRMVITSGFNVYPREVEIVLEMHPAVAAARVEGKEDMMRGEIVKALIVRKPGAEADEKEILRHCRTYLSSYKIPREVEFVGELSKRP